MIGVEKGFTAHSLVDGAQGNYFYNTHLRTLR